jgi:hypothetical protein
VIVIEFTQARDTMKYGKVRRGDRISVHPEEADSFIAQGVARKCGKTNPKPSTEEVTQHV